MTSSRVVIGLGSPDRGDDAVGPEVARRVADLHLPGVTVVEHEDPTGLIDLWDTADLAVVVDAVRSGSAPGSLLVVESG
ncbi:MAG TPA: hydrogenase maturation protease, partial [Cellulomonas sp.]